MRQPAVAGAFYPSDSKALENMIQNFLSQVPKKQVSGEILAMVVPHAGYIYSGPVAAYAYKEIAGNAYDTVILLGPSHRVPLNGAAVYGRGSFLTPLGELLVNEELAKELEALSPLIQDQPQAHTYEHSLEVQLPFLQEVLKPGFKILPIELSNSQLSVIQGLAQALLKVFQPGKHLILASTDLSHYHPDELALKLDKPTLELMEKMEIEKLSSHLNQRKGELCGEDAVLTALLVMKKLLAKGKLLHYDNSGAVSGDKSQVVGYGAMAFYLPEKPAQAEPESSSSCELLAKAKSPTESELSPAEQKTLLEIARRVLDTYIKDGKVPELKVDLPILNEKRGIFVTLRKGKNKDLRGCIGYILAQKPLREAIVEMTIASATQDFRFPPVKAGELSELSIEISLLSPLKPESSPENIVMGKHGVYLKKGFKSGIFLPQVADETGWDRETFLRHLCADKAGLSPDAWKDPKTQLSTFTVTHFEESR